MTARWGGICWWRGPPQITTALPTLPRFCEWSKPCIWLACCVLTAVRPAATWSSSSPRELWGGAAVQWRHWSHTRPKFSKVLHLLIVLSASNFLTVLNIKQKNQKKKFHYLGFGGACAFMNRFPQLRYGIKWIYFQLYSTLCSILYCFCIRYVMASIIVRRLNSSQLSYTLDIMDS